MARASAHSLLRPKSALIHWLSFDGRRKRRGEVLFLAASGNLFAVELSGERLGLRRVALSASTNLKLVALVWGREKASYATLILTMMERGVGRAFSFFGARL